MRTKRLDEVKASYGNDMNGPIFKLEHDPRIFPFGRFLRKFSIDELPQLINVLKGEMSLVGPRPLPVYETEAFTSDAHRRRLSVLPGVTGYWQIAGRSNIREFEKLVELDMEYIDNWSLWLDVKLLMKLSRRCCSPAGRSDAPAFPRIPEMQAGGRRLQRDLEGAGASWQAGAGRF